MTDQIIHIGSGGLQSQNNNPPSLEDIIQQYLNSIKRQLKSTTVEAYEKSLRFFFAWLSDNKYKFNVIKHPVIEAYIIYLEEKQDDDGKKLSSYTINSYMAGIFSFYTWLEASYSIIDPCRAIKLPKREAKFERSALTEDQVSKLFEYFEKEGNIRDEAIVKLFYFGGFRTIEVERMDVCDFKKEGPVRVVWVMGKGRDAKDRRVKIYDHAWAPVLRYLYTREDLKETDPLFVSESTFGGRAGQRLTKSTLSRIIKRGLNAIGLTGDEYTAHSLRHSAGTIAHLNGASLEQVQDMLRHANSATTKIYARAAIDQKWLQENTAELNLMPINKGWVSVDKSLPRKYKVNVRDRVNNEFIAEVGDMSAWAAKVKELQIKEWFNG